MMRRERPVTSATMSSAEALDDLVERARHRRQACEFLDQPVTPGDRFAALDGLAVAIDRSRREIALASVNGS
jgi:hypothetical protein